MLSVGNYATSLSFSVLCGEGRAISTLWELDAKNLVLSMIETQITVTVIIITLVRKLKYYDCLLSYFTELGKKQWSSCGLCQVSSSKSDTTYLSLGSFPIVIGLVLMGSQCVDKNKGHVFLGLSQFTLTIFFQTI